jgi:phosphoribosyl 1,2-cyclic phosphodiesterase
MSEWFTVLASGSSGNASLLESAGAGLLIDCGVGPRVLAERLAAIGRTWRSVTAVLLTHTHSDHWNRLTLAHLARLRIPLYLHRRHGHELSSRCEFTHLHQAGLVREYVDNQPLPLGPGLVARPVPVPHDSNPTYAFRFDREISPGESWSLGFASDVGHAARHLVEAFAGVSVLALEYNHDEHMQKTSRRPAILIRRVLGDHGHLSNSQGAELTMQIAGSSNGLFQHLVQLHLSRECNTPDLAVTAGRTALLEAAPRARLITSSQFHPTVPLPLTAQPTPSPAPVAALRQSVQLTLPGLEAG